MNVCIEQRKQTYAEQSGTKQKNREEKETNEHSYTYETI